jgi:sugar/nucleoside kinase (ribokinase family)
LTYAGSLNAVYPEDITNDFLSLGKHLHYCSYYLQTNLLPAVSEALAGRKLNVPYPLIPIDPMKMGWICMKATITDILPNEREAQAITRCQTLAEAISRLPDLTQLTVIKMGIEGAMIVKDGFQQSVPVAPVSRVVDTVGAGDSFDGGFIAAWLRDLSLETCASIGNACGRANIQARGGIAGQLWRADLPEMA